MKLITTSAISFLIAGTAFAAKNTAAVNVAPTTTIATQETVATAAPATAPKWNFLIGSSNYKNGGDDRTDANSGLSFAIERKVYGFLSGGVSAATFDIDGANLRHLSAYISLAPIKYTHKNLKISAAFLTGGIHETMPKVYTDAIQYGFMGAAIEASYKNSIGLRLDQKMSSEFDAITTASLVGYY
jgi:hypothetical protein